MKPCVVCGKLIKKKDSVMTLVYVCSDSCKIQRKSTIPKRASITTVKYWTNRGLSEIEAKDKISELQRKRSPRCVEHWLSKGFSLEDAIENISVLQSSFGKQNALKYSKEELQQRAYFSKKNCIKRGMTEKEANAFVKKKFDSMSLDYFINQFGKDEGTLKYQSLCQYRKTHYTLEGYIARYGPDVGEQLWSKKFKNRHNSNSANQFFKELIPLFNEVKIYSATNENGEYGVLDRANNQYYFYDFVVPEMKLCIEYYGDYWHCNPKKYKADYFHKQSKKTAEKIWELDKKKLECLQKEREFHTIVVWESDDKVEMLTRIKEIIYESAKSKN